MARIPRPAFFGYAAVAANFGGSISREKEIPDLTADEGAAQGNT